MKKYFPYFLILFLVGVLLGFIRRSPDVVYEDRVVRDTLIVRQIDTVLLEKPEIVKEVVLDTVYVVKYGDSVFNLPVVQRMYSSAQYMAWVSGYNPSLDSVKVFNQIEYVYINNDIVRHTYDRRSSFYLNASLVFWNNTFLPKVSASVVTPDRIKFDIGLMYGKGNWGFEAGIGYKIF